MKKIRDIIFWSLAVILAVGMARAAEDSSAQIITLEDGTKLTLLGVTYGSHHIAPHFEEIGGHLRNGNWINTPSNSTVVWVKSDHTPGGWPSYELLVYDSANTACVPVEKSSESYVSGAVDVQCFVLRAFPRWQKQVTLRAAPYRGKIGEGQFVITNQPQEPVLTWKPNPLPNTQTDGDLTVTLKNLYTRAPMPELNNEHKFPNDLREECVHLYLDWEQNGQPATNWFPWLVWTTDEYGNRVNGAIRDYTTYLFPNYSNQEGYYYQPSLWPYESAWKVRIEFTRNSGFSDDEIVTFTNIPVQAGSEKDWNDEWNWNDQSNNFSFVTATVNGMHLKLLPPLLTPDSNSPSPPDQKRVNVIIMSDVDPLQRIRMTVLQATDEQGHELWHPFNPDWAGHFSLDFPRVNNIKTLTLKLALHKSRFVEFTVNPNTN